MLNPTFFQVDTQDGEMRLQTPRLDRVDPRILDDLGLTDAEWASATGSSSVRVLHAAFLEKVRQVFVRRPPHGAAASYRSYHHHKRTFCFLSRRSMNTAERVGCSGAGCPFRAHAYTMLGPMW